VVQIQILAVKNFAAVLAGVLIPLVDVVSGKFDLLARHPVEEEEDDHTGNTDLERYGVDHVVARFALGEILPTGEIVCEEIAIGGVYHLRVPRAQKDESASDGADMDSLPEPIENKDASIDHTDGLARRRLDIQEAPGGTRAAGSLLMRNKIEARPSGCAPRRPAFGR
jgi:hypothetical protein